MKIALDAMGGDLAPRATVEGAVLAARDLGVDIVLVGDRDVIARELAEHDAQNLAIRVEHAAEVVAMDDSPLESALTKTNSSIHAGLEMIKRGDADAFVSAGNSGAMMTAAMMILGTLPGVDRPAIGTLFPASNGVALLIDAGANTETKPHNLVQFAIMGSVYSARVRHVARPRVALLSNGEESSKGTDLTRAAAAALCAMPSLLNYIGYVEGRDMNRGKADVVVTDGFTGNVALKTMEGLAAYLFGNLREVFAGSIRGRIAYLLLRKRLAAMRRRMDPSEFGGAPLLGVNGVAIIAHGSSSAHTIRNAIRAAAEEVRARSVNQEITDLIARTASIAPVRGAAGKGLRAMFSRMRDRLSRHRAPDRSPARPQEPVGHHPQEIVPVPEAAAPEVESRAEQTRAESAEETERGARDDSSNNEFAASSDSAPLADESIPPDGAATNNGSGPKISDGARSEAKHADGEAGADSGGNEAGEKPRDRLARGLSDALAITRDPAPADGATRNHIDPFKRDRS